MVLKSKVGGKMKKAAISMKDYLEPTATIDCDKEAPVEFLTNGHKAASAGLLKSCLVV